MTSLPEIADLLSLGHSANELAFRCVSYSLIFTILKIALFLRNKTQDARKCHLM